MTGSDPVPPSGVAPDATVDESESGVRPTDAGDGGDGSGDDATGSEQAGEHGADPTGSADDTPPLPSLPTLPVLQGVIGLSASPLPGSDGWQPTARALARIDTEPTDRPPTMAEINAVRAAIRNTTRHERGGLLVGRSILAVLVACGIVAAAVVFARPVVFPVEWTAELIPIVDDVESSTGLDFDRPVEVVELPPGEYGTVVAELVLGAGWTRMVPEWRALGIASGDGAVAEVEARLARLYPAFHDADAGRIVAAQGVSLLNRAPALRLAVADVLARQTGGEGSQSVVDVGVTGAGAPDVVARRAFDAATVGLTTVAPVRVDDLAGLPLPVAYQILAVASLAGPLGAGGSGVVTGDPLPLSVTSLSDSPVLATGVVRPPAELPETSPMPLGPDGWSMIWGARIDPGRAVRLAETLVADSYETVERSGTACVIAVFDTTTVEAAGALESALVEWSRAAPAGAPTAVAATAPTKLQLETCDPGPSATATPDISSVVALVERQVARLAGR